MRAVRIASLGAQLQALQQAADAERVDARRRAEVEQEWQDQNHALQQALEQSRQEVDEGKRRVELSTIARS